MDNKLIDLLDSLAIASDRLTGNSYIVPCKDFSVLQDFTDEELAQELLRRTSLGKELE